MEDAKDSSLNGGESDAVIHPSASADDAGAVIPVVGLGGSAGSLDALRRFFLKLPADSGMAFVVVVHLLPEHESMMVSILQRSTTMPVAQVNDTVEIQPDHVYVISPGQQLSMSDGRLQTVEMPRQRGRHTTIDLFFRTLAETHGSEAIAVVLSGGDGDGAIGLKRIKERGGLTIAQDPTEAEMDSMPLTAIATGMVDWILPAEEIAGKIIKFQESGKKIQLPPVITDDRTQPLSAEQEEKEESAFRDILAFLKARTGHEFADYKRATVLRRIGRRMQVNEAESLEIYLNQLRTHPGETGALLQDLLISVTNFFRDREAFSALEGVIPDLFKNKTDSDQVRVWIPGCATGEEAYSMAILLCEHAATLESPPQIQIFATDLDQAAINVAREGRYPEPITGDVSEQRLAQFFSKEAGSYRVRRSVREMVLFAKHDLLKDSPFSRLDLISCRNLLIYLNRDAQGRVFDIFHFALRPEGRLFLGSSESAEDATALFYPINKKHRIFARRSIQRVGLSVPAGAPTLSFAFQADQKLPPVIPLPPVPFLGLAGAGPLAKAEQTERNSWSELHYKLIETIAPPSLVIGRDQQIMHLSKSAGRFLQFAGGEPTMNLLRVVHPALRTELRAALFRASKTQAPVQITGIPVELDSVPRLVDISVEPVDDLAPDFLLVLFRERDVLHPDLSDSGSSPASLLPEDRAVIRHLEEELDQMRLGLRETVEQYEASVEELKASNEELQAMNEELRSATEELETGREELQSINEEIITINQELKSKVEEVSRTNSDLQNLMASTKIPTIFLDRDLRIKRFTPSATDLFNLIPTDIGRPLSDITHRFEYPVIITDAARVLEDLALVEREVRTLEGQWFLARMCPYRSTEDQISGVVITCVEITERKAADETRRWLSAIVESSSDAIISFTMDGNIVSWNQGAQRIFGYTPEEIIGQSQALLAPPEKYQEKREILEKLRRGEAIDQFDTIRLRKDGQLIDVSLSISVMRNETGGIVGATSIAQDITLRTRAVEDLKHARQELESRVQERTAELRKRIAQLAIMTSELTLAEQRERKRMAHVLHDQLQQILVAAKLRIESLDDGDMAKREKDVAKLVALMDEALANSRSLAVDLSPPILGEGLGKALNWLCSIWMRDKYDLIVTCNIDDSIDTPQVDLRILLYLAVKELLFNVVKHSKVSEATVDLAIHDPGHLCVTIRDCGMGFDMEKVDGKNISVTGFGLIGLYERLEMLGGKLEIHSRPNEGVEAVIIAPMKKQELSIFSNP
ncbi:MAG: chemotaxis protein CheB [Verrucomicrobiota bacterium]